MSPRAGTRIKRGSTVRHTVTCCQRLRRPPKLARSASVAPKLTGYGAAVAGDWAGSRRLLFSAELGPLHNAQEKRLLANYVVTRQTAGRARELVAKRRRHTAKSTRVADLRIRAVQGRPACPACRRCMGAPSSVTPTR